MELTFIRPGKPLDSPYIENFHSRFRDECLNERWSWESSAAQRQIEAWRQVYHTARPHESLKGQTLEELAAILQSVEDPKDPTSILTGPALG